MEDGLHDLQRAALDQAANTRTLDDIERAASVAKSLADAQKSASDAQNSARQLRLQQITSISTVLVPLVSLLALFATIYVQSEQLRETRAQNIEQQDAARQQSEDTQWRDLLTSLRGSADSFDSDVTVAPRLISFFQSSRHGDQAREISIRLMGRLTSSEGFQDLYNIVFPNMTPGTFAKIVGVGRALNATRNSIEVECFNLSVTYKLPNVFGLCNIGANIPTIASSINAPFPDRALQLRQALPGIYAEIAFVSEAIGKYLQLHFNVGNTNTSRESVDLSRMLITFADLSNVDFDNINFTGTGFVNIKFDNADLRLNHPAIGTSFTTSNWWDARAIDPQLLEFLVKNQYPFWDGKTDFRPFQPPTQEHYKQQIAKLCDPVRPYCDVSKLNFGPPAMSNAISPSGASQIAGSPK